MTGPRPNDGWRPGSDAPGPAAPDARNPGEVTTGRRRVHPLTPLLTSARFLVAFLAVLAVNAVQFRPGDAKLGDVVAELGVWPLVVAVVGLLVLLGLIALGNWVSWRYRFYEITADEVRIGSGWIARSRRTARLDRVQAVDINQPLLARLVGLGELKVETAGGSDSDLTIKFLTMDDCRRLRADILEATRRKQGTGASFPTDRSAAPGVAGAAPGPAGEPAPGPAGEPAPGHPGEPAQESWAVPPPRHPGAAPASHPAPHRTGDPEAMQPRQPVAPLSADATLLHGPVPPLRLFGSAALGPGLLVIVGVPAVFLISFVVAAALGVPGLDDPWEILLATAGSVIGSTAIGAVVFFAGLIGAIWTKWDTFHGFTLHADDSAGRLSLKAGLTSTRRQTIPVRRIHALEIAEPAWWRPLHWAQLRTNVAGYAGEGQETSTVLLPVAPVEEADTVLDGIVGRITDMDRSPSEAKWASPARAVWVSPVDWRRQTVRITPRALVVTAGRFRRRRAVVPWARIQGYTLKQGPVSKALGLASVRIDLVSGPVSVIAADLAPDDAARVMRVIEARKSA